MTGHGTVVLLSGGLDSAVLLASLYLEGPVDALSVHYGQRHARELEAAAAIARHYGVRHDVVDLSAVAGLLAPSALTGPGPDVPDGYYTAPSMAATVVPGRNLLFLAVASAAAAARGRDRVAIAVHAGDHPVYPDCRMGFIGVASRASVLGTAGCGDVRITAPFARMTKAQIVRLGSELGVPMHLAWSCYRGGDVHCGRCGTCTERAEAFSLAGVPDPTGYADPGYWREVPGSRCTG